MSNTFVFGYGSLVHRSALERFLGHPLAPNDFDAADLTGYHRSWNVARDNRRSPHREVYVHEDGSRHQGTVTVLGIDPDPDRMINGAIVRVGPGDLALLDRREAMYDRVDVTASVSGTRIDVETVFTYVPNTTHRRIHREGVRASIDAVSSHYIGIVTAGFRALGTLDAYHATTTPPRSPVRPIRKRP